MEFENNKKFLSDNILADRINTFQWEFNLVKDKTQNDWSMPGGKVVFYDGILPICETEQGVAVVMGHDTAETIRFWERMSKLGDANVPEFLSTHPISENRVAALKKALPEMGKYKP